MAETNTMTYQDAYDALSNQVWCPVFFEKLAADWGIRPTTEDEAREFLVLAGKLEQLEQANHAKQASERSSVVSQASKSLDSVLNRMGVQPIPSYTDAEVKAAAAQLSQVPQLRDAALLYQDSMKQLAAK